MSSKRFCMPDAHLGLTDGLLTRHIERGSRVIDLGCGDGRLLELLRDQHGCEVQGVELDLDGITGCLTRGVPVIAADLDEHLAAVPDAAFDVAVLSQTLQQLRHPTTVLTEMLRIAKRALVVVPNFGHWKVRQQVVLHGRAPVTSELPYEWYNTPNLHFMSMRDFRDLAERLHFNILQEVPIVRGQARRSILFANLRAESLLYVYERAQSATAS